MRHLARDYYHNPKVIFGVFVELVAAAIGGVIPLTLQWSLSGRTITSRTWIGIALFFGLMVVQGAMSGGGRYLLAKPADIWINRIRNRVFGHAIRMPMGYLDSHSSGELANHTINDIHTLETYVTDDVPGLIGGGLQGLIIIVVMFAIDWPTAVAMFAIDVIAMGLALLLSVRITSYAGQRQGKRRGSTGRRPTSSTRSGPSRRTPRSPTPRGGSASPRAPRCPPPSGSTSSSPSTTRSSP